MKLATKIQFNSLWCGLFATIMLTWLNNHKLILVLFSWVYWKCWDFGHKVSKIVPLKLKTIIPKVFKYPEILWHDSSFCPHLYMKTFATFNKRKLWKTRLATSTKTIKKWLWNVRNICNFQCLKKTCSIKTKQRPLMLAIKKQ